MDVYAETRVQRHARRGQLLSWLGASFRVISDAKKAAERIASPPWVQRFRKELLADVEASIYDVDALSRCWMPETPWPVAAQTLSA
eukprot:scaffold193275_cov17-Prasinocladus_malaysianus.AAC.1